MSGITPETHPDPFRFLDAKVAEFKLQRTRATDMLKACGWVLRPNHPISMMWRARRWTEAGGTQRLSSPTCDGLIALVVAEAEPRLKARRERAEAKKKKQAKKAGKAA